MSICLPINVVVWFAWIGFYGLFLIGQFYFLHCLSVVCYKWGREDDDAYRIPMFLGSMLLMAINFFVILASSMLCEVGLERQGDYILYKRSSSLGCIYSYGIKDTKNNRNIKQYQDGEFDILLSEAFKDYDINTNKYFKITIGGE